MDWVRSFRALASVLRFSRKRNMEAATDYVQTSEFHQLMNRVQQDLGAGLHELAVTGTDRSDGDRLLAAISGL